MKIKKSIKVSGKKIKNTDKEYKNFQMDRFIKGLIKMENLKVWAVTLGIMDKVMKEDGEKEKDMAQVFGNDKMEKYTMVNGALENLMGMEFLQQAMEIFIKDNLNRH